MKHTPLILLSSLLLHASALPAAEVVVYSPPSTSPLHVAIVSTNDLSTSGERVFPASYTGHRAVCSMPGASTNDTFVAWIGGDAFVPGDPYGTSAGRDLPQIELTRTSPVTPRIDIVGKSADRVRTIDEIYTNIVESVYAQNLPPIDQSNALENLSWMQSNVISEPTVDKNKFTRVRVVRWLVDGSPVWEVNVPPRVVYDQTFSPGQVKALTEGDFLGEESVDLDWKFFKTDIVGSLGVRAKRLSVSEADYLVVLGDGVTSFRGRDDTNNVVKALSTVVSRHYGTNHVQAVALPSVAQPVSHPVFRFRADCPELSGYTACQLQVTSANGSVTNWTSGTVRIPPRDIDGTYVYSAPDLTGAVSTDGTYSWRAIVYNAKFNEEPLTGPVYWSKPPELKWSAPAPATFK